MIRKSVVKTSVIPELIFLISTKNVIGIHFLNMLILKFIRTMIPVILIFHKLKKENYFKNHILVV